MDKLDIFATRTIDSGVVPIELKFIPVYDCLFSGVAGFRGRAVVNSVLYGSLLPSDYLSALEEDRDLAVTFTARSLRAVLLDLSRLRPETRDISLLSVQCPVSMVKRGTLPAEFVRALRGTEPNYVGLICFEFGAELLRLPKKTVTDLLLSVRALGCRVAVSGYGREDFPMFALSHAAPDFLILSEPASWEEARLTAFVSFAQSLGARVLAEGVGSEAQLKRLNAARCDVYTPAPGLRVNGQSLFADKALAQLLTERGLAGHGDAN